MLSEQLEQVIGKQLGRRHWEFFVLTRVWSDVVGERAAAHTLPAWIRKDALWVYVDGSAWMQDLSYMKPQILQQVNKQLCDIVLTDIRWLQQPQKIMQASNREYSSPDRPVDRKQAEEFFQMTQVIDDSGCQQALFNLWQTFQKKMR